MDSLAKRRNTDIRLWNVRSCIGLARELSKYKLDLVGVQEVSWEGSGTEPVGEYRIVYEKRNENHELGVGFLCIRESYQQLRG
jgi:hypothetical protein